MLSSAKLIDLDNISFIEISIEYRFRKQSNLVRYSYIFIIKCNSKYNQDYLKINFNEYLPIDESIDDILYRIGLSLD